MQFQARQEYRKFRLTSHGHSGKILMRNGFHSKKPKKVRFPMAYWGSDRMREDGEVRVRHRTDVKCILSFLKNIN